MSEIYREQKTDVRIMTLRRLNQPQSDTVHKILQEDEIPNRYVSFQYYQLIDISAVELDENKLFYSAYQTVRKMRKNRILNQSGKLSALGNTTSIQQRILVFGEDSGFWDDDPPKTLYISMLQFYDIQAGRDIENARKKILCKLPEDLKAHCALYYTLDFCDLILFTKNITPIKLRDFLRQITFFVEDDGQRLIRDTVTISGFSAALVSDNFRRISSGEEMTIAADAYQYNTSLLVSLSIRSANHFKNFMDELYKIKEEPFQKRIFGRYDVQLFLENLDIQQVLRVLYQIDRFCIEDSEKPEGAISGYEIVEAKNKKDNGTYSKEKAASSQFINAVFDAVNFRYKKYVETLSEDTEVFGYAIGLKESFLALTKNGMSEEFVLAVLPSFLMYLRIVTDYPQGQREKRVPQTDPLEWKCRIQKEYLQCLSLLVHCTMHGEKQFIQAPALNLNIFDVPPKLLTFYAGLSYYITDLLNDSADAKYSFLIAPDFRKDIHVMQISPDFEREEKLLIMYLNERQFYDPVTVIHLMCHEIAHHVGKKARNREYRAQSVFRAICSYLLLESMPSVCFPEGEKGSQLFDQLINGFSEVFLCHYEEYVGNLNADSLLPQYRGSGKKIQEICPEKLFHLKLVRRFLLNHNFLIEPLTKDDEFCGKLIDCWAKKICDCNLQDFISLKERGLNSSYLSHLYHNGGGKSVAEILSGFVILSIQEKIRLWQSANDMVKPYYEFCLNLLETYREAYSDYRMVELLEIWDGDYIR